MLWLPGQQRLTPASRWIGRLTIGPDHASALPARGLSECAAQGGYGAVGVVGAPDDDAADMYLRPWHARSRRLPTYEISNVSRPGRESRTTSSTGRTAIGWRSAAAPTARGMISRWRNVAGTSDYMTRVRDGGSVRGRTDAARRLDALPKRRSSWACAWPWRRPAGIRDRYGVESGRDTARRGAVRRRRPPRARARATDLS